MNRDNTSVTLTLIFLLLTAERFCSRQETTERVGFEPTSGFATHDVAGRLLSQFAYLSRNGAIFMSGRPELHYTILFIHAGNVS